MNAGEVSVGASVGVVVWWFGGVCRFLLESDSVSV